MKRIAILFVVACSGGGPPITGNGSGPAPALAGACDDIKAKVEQLYRAEAEVKEPKRVDAAVADNTQMVINDCARDPGKVSACVQAAKTIAEIETKCLHPLDDDGSEGNDLK